VEQTDASLVLFRALMGDNEELAILLHLPHPDDSGMPAPATCPRNPTSALPAGIGATTSPVTGALSARRPGGSSGIGGERGTVPSLRRGAR